MFTRADIRRVSIAVTEKDYSTLMVSLGKSGLLHIDSGDAYVTDETCGSPFLIDTAAAESVITCAEEFLNETYSSQGENFDYDLLLEDIPSLILRDSESDLHEARRIKNKIKHYASVRTLLEDEIASLDAKLARIRGMHRSGIDLAQLRGLKSISYIYGRVRGNGWRDSIDKRIFYIKNGEYILFMMPGELKEAMLHKLHGDGFEDLDYIIRPGYSSLEEESAVLSRIGELNRRIKRIDACYSDQLPHWRVRMRYLEAVYSILLKISGAETGNIFSRELVVINGWIDVRDSAKLRSLLHEVCGNGFYYKTGSRVESRRLRDLVPVRLKNNPLLRPFELLVKMMGIPGNSEVDPTPAAALAYVVIFGIMFGDLGQGLVLAMAGFALNLYGRKKFRSRNDLSDFGSIMIWCGFSAALTGVLYGSFFSNEHIIPALLFHPMENMMQLLLMAVMTGTVFISLGLLLNIINGIISARYADSLLGSRGLPGLAVYGSFIFFSMRFILSGQTPGTTEIMAVLVIPVAIFSLRGPLEFMLLRGEHVFHNGPFEYIVETVIEIIEMFSGFLGNTISYIRAGAFALSHAGLSIAVFTLAGIVDPLLKSTAAIAVIVIGNVFIILLEGLVCGIQSMRLEFYEFFGKFFKGDGSAFEPFTLGMKQANDGGSK